MAPSESRFDWTCIVLGDLCQARANSQDWHFGIAQLMAPSESRFDWTCLILGDLCRARANSHDWHFGIAQEDVEANLVFTMEDKPTFLFFHFQCTGSEILNARHGALFLKSLHKIFILQVFWLPGTLDLHRQHTTKATGNAQHLHLQTLSLALALVRRSRCEHLFFLRLMGTNPRSSPFTPDTRLPNWDLNRLPNKKYQMIGNTRIRA